MENDLTQIGTIAPILLHDIEELPDEVRSRERCRVIGRCTCHAACGRVLEVRGGDGRHRRVSPGVVLVHGPPADKVHKLGRKQLTSSEPRTAAQPPMLDSAFHVPAFAFGGYGNWERYRALGGFIHQKNPPVPRMNGNKTPAQLLIEAMETNGATCFWWALHAIITFQQYSVARQANPVWIGLESAGVTVQDALDFADPASPRFLGVMFNVCAVLQDGTLVDARTQNVWHTQPAALRFVPSNAFLAFVWVNDAGRYEPHVLPFTSSVAVRISVTQEESLMVEDHFREAMGAPRRQRPVAPTWNFVQRGRFRWGIHSQGRMGVNPPVEELEEAGLIITRRPVWADPLMDAERIVYTSDLSSTYSAEVREGKPGTLRKFWRQAFITGPGIIDAERKLAVCFWHSSTWALLQSEVRAGDVVFSEISEWPSSKHQLPSGELNLSQLHSLRLSTGVAYPLDVECRFIDSSGKEWLVRRVLPAISLNFSSLLAKLPFVDEVVSGFSWYDDPAATINDYPSKEMYIWTRYRALMLTIPKEEMYLIGILNRNMEAALDAQDYRDPFIQGNQIIEDARALMGRQGYSVQAFST